MNLFLREMKANRKSLISWCIGVMLLIGSGMSKYGTLGDSGQSITELIKTMPRSLQAIWGTGSLDLTQASGYYGVLFLYLVLMAAIHAIMLGANILAKEERDKTSEFLMAKPISRTKIVTDKLMAALVNVTVFNLITLITSIKMVAYYSESNSTSDDIILLMAGMFLLQLVFLAAGLGIAAVNKRPKSSASLGTGILLLSFILSIMVNINEKLDNLKYLTPFKYFEAKEVIGSGKLEPVYVIISVFIITAMLSITYIFYRKKDLNS